ncbi:MAG: metallophosphoesterase family protein [Persicimonas sp.]
MRKLTRTLLTLGLAAVLLAACTHAVTSSGISTTHQLVVEDTERPAEAPRERSSSESGQTREVEEAAPAEDASPEELTVAVVSDLNGSYGSTDYHDEVHGAVDWLVEDIGPDLVVATGDMVAGQKRGLDYLAMWDGFHAAVTEPLARAGIPLAVTPGNHDASAGAVYLEERVTYVEQWQRHRPDVRFVDDTFYPLHYAFEVGPALFISLDATITGPIDAEQRRWLDRVLSAHSDKAVKVVFGHVPLYPFSEERKNEILDDRDLEALLREHGVDLMLSGHHHAYYPGKRDDLRLVSMACLGSGNRTLIGDDRPSEKSVALLRISEDGEVSVEAYDAEDQARIERGDLPAHLNSGRHRIWRDDVSQVAWRR